MNCHLVPKVYLKPWKISSSSNGIYVFDKTFWNKAGTQKNICNLSDTSFAFKNYYVLDETNPSHQFALRNTPNLSEKEKHIIETDYFANKVERNWKTFLNYVNSTLMNKKVIKIAESYKSEFLEFFAIQFFRKVENFKWLIMDNILDTVDDMLVDGKLTANERMNTTDSLFFNALLKQSKGERNHINTMIEVFGCDFQIMFLFSNGNTSFITSDNPCFYYNALNEKCAGTYMPINKKVCAYLVKPKVVQESKYLIVDISENNTKYINKLISDHSITSLGYDSADIGNLFEANFNEREWTTSMTKVLLA